MDNVTLYHKFHSITKHGLYVKLTILQAQLFSVENKTFPVLTGFRDLTVCRHD